MREPPKVSLAELEYAATEAQKNVQTERGKYIGAREAAMKALLERRDFYYCRDHGLIGAEDEDLHAAIILNLEEAKDNLGEARRDYLIAMQTAQEMRHKLDYVRGKLQRLVGDSDDAEHGQRK